MVQPLPRRTEGSQWTEQSVYHLRRVQEFMPLGTLASYPLPGWSLCLLVIYQLLPWGKVRSSVSLRSHRYTSHTQDRAPL